MARGAHVAVEAGETLLHPYSHVGACHGIPNFWNKYKAILVLP